MAASLIFFAVSLFYMFNFSLVVDYLSLCYGGVFFCGMVTAKVFM